MISSVNGLPFTLRVECQKSILLYKMVNCLISDYLMIRIMILNFIGYTLFLIMIHFDLDLIVFFTRDLSLLSKYGIIYHVQ